MYKELKKVCGAISHDKEWKVVGSKSVIHVRNLVINDVFKRCRGVFKSCD